MIAMMHGAKGRPRDPGAKQFTLLKSLLGVDNLLLVILLLLLFVFFLLIVVLLLLRSVL